MLNLDPGKLLVIAAVALILLGPDRLPQVARQIGGFWRTVNEFRHRMESEVRSSIPDLPASSEISRLARSPSALLNHLSNMLPDPEGTAGTPISGTADPPGRPIDTHASPTAAWTPSTGAKPGGRPKAVPAADPTLN